MKKFVLTFLCSLCLGLALLPHTALASGSAATVSALTPSSEEQYQLLDSPVDVWYDGEGIAISDKQRITLYTFADGKLYGFDGLVANTGLARWNNFLFFISENKLKYVDYTDENGTVEQLNPQDVIACEAFSLFGDTLVCSQSKNTVLYFNLSVEAGAPLATKDEERSFSGANSLLYLTESGGQQVLYYYSDHYIFRKTESGNIDGKRIDGDVRRMAAKDNFVYYTTPSGIFCLDFDSDEPPVSYAQHLTADQTLTSFTSPFGIAFRGGRLLVADSGNNAVQEFDADADGGAGKFTGYAVTTCGDIAGRLSADASDVAADETARYYADSGNKRVQIINSASGEITALPLPFTPERVMPGDKYIFVCGQDGSSPVYALISRNNLSAEVVPVRHEDVYSSILSVTYTDGCFYFATADLGVKQGKLLRLRESDASLAVLYERNTPIAVASDVSGTVYYCYKFGSEIRMRIESAGDWSVRDESGDILLSSQPVKLQVDFESNVYALQADNTVLRYSKSDGYQTVTEYSLSLAPNLLQQFDAAPNAVSFAFTFASEGAVVLYPNGLAGTTAQLEIATPLHVEVPQDFALLSPNTPTADGVHPEIKQIKAGSNLYLFDIGELASKNLSYFPYKRYTRLSSDLTVMVTAYTGNYAVVVYADQSDNRFATAIVPSAHLSDGVQPEPIEPQFAEGHTLTRVNGFKYPILSEYFSVTLNGEGNASGLSKGHTVILIAEYTLTDYELKADGTVGGNYRYYDAIFDYGGKTVRAYLPASMVAQSLVEDMPAVSYRLQEVKPAKGGVISVYSDTSKSYVLAEISRKTQVRVYDEQNGFALISYEDENGMFFGYIEDGYVAANGKKTPVTVTVIILFALSLTATAIFFITRPKLKEGE